MAQSIDIMPTILDILNIPIPEEAQGVSLRGLWENKNDSGINKYVYAVSPVGLESIRSSDYKFIYHIAGKQHELYDLIRDPQEKNNLYGQNFDIANNLKAEISKWKNNLFFYAGQGKNFSHEIDEETYERIKKTGYW